MRLNRRRASVPVPLLAAAIVIALLSGVIVVVLLGDGRGPTQTGMQQVEIGEATAEPTQVSTPAAPVFEDMANSALEAVNALARGEKLPYIFLPEAERSIRQLVEPDDPNNSEEANARMTSFEPERRVVWEEASLPDGYNIGMARVLETKFRGGTIAHAAAGFSPASEGDLEGERFQVLIERRGDRWVLTDVALGYEVDGK